MNKTIRLYLLFFSLVICNATNSQPSITWEKTYNRPNTQSDRFTGICEADSGNFFQVGYTPVESVGWKIWVVKINAYGDTLWNRIIGQSSGVAYTVV